MGQETGGNQTGFSTPAGFPQQQAERTESPRGGLFVASCHSGAYLGIGVAERYQELLSEAGSGGRVRHLDGVGFRFSDS